MQKVFSSASLARKGTVGSASRGLTRAEPLEARYQTGDWEGDYTRVWALEECHSIVNLFLIAKIH
jgi:hypothetical protein